MSEVNIEINGKSYRMACEKGEEEHLFYLGSRFESSIVQLREKFGDIDDERLTIMAAMIITDQLVEAEKLVTKGNSEIANLRQVAENQGKEHQQQNQETAEKISAIAERIESLCRRLNQGFQTGIKQ